MKHFFNSLNKLINNINGQGLLEYGLIITIIAIGCIASLLFLAPKVVNLFTSASNNVS